MTLYVTLDPPYKWVRLENEKVEGHGEVPLIGDYPTQPGEELIGIIDGSHVSCHYVELPTKTRKQFDLALPFSLEDRFAQNVESLHFVALNWKPNQKVTVLAVDNSSMRRWHDCCLDNQLVLSALIPDYALLPAHSSTSHTVSVGGDNEVSIKTRDSGSCIRLGHEHVDLWLSTLPLGTSLAINNEQWVKDHIEKLENIKFFHWDFGERIEHWLELRSTGVEQAYNLLKGQWLPKSSLPGKRAWKVPLFIIAATVLIGLAGSLYEYMSLNAESNKLRKDMMVMLAEKAPDIDFVDPGSERAIFERLHSAPSSNHQKAEFLFMLSKVAPELKRVNAKLQGLNYRNRQINITCELSDFTQVDKLLSALKSIAEIEVVLQASNASEQKTTARFNIVTAGVASNE